MFKDTDGSLQKHLDQSTNIEIGSVVYAEINMNEPDNIKVIGNYRNRPTYADSTFTSTVPSTFIIENDGDTIADPKYRGATDSDTTINGGLDPQNNNTPIAFASRQQRAKLVYSLEDCFLNFRPRSGINKAVSFGKDGSHFIHNTYQSMMLRPRYYMSDKNDNFKYWTSFRQEVATAQFLAGGGNKRNVDRGIANNYAAEKKYLIDDASPFVVYNDKVATNRIVIKIQTHVGTSKIGTIADDPLYDEPAVINNRRVPTNWKLEYLDANNTWHTLKAFEDGYINNTPVFARDGYLELRYDAGEWVINDQSLLSESHLADDFINPSVLISGSDTFYEQFQYIYGLRMVVNSMSRRGSTLDLIELSPRLAINLTSIVPSYSVKKIASDISASGMPVGQLLAATGSMEIADYEQVLNSNSGSIIAEHLGRNTQIKLYEAIKNVDVAGTKTTFYVPIKTMYVDKFPETSVANRTATVQLRDLYSYFESIQAPELLITEASLSYTIATIFDSIGFTNYIYKKSDQDKEPIIPVFHVSPNTTVAQVLQDLAISTQSVMFFDEFNNFVIMSKRYMLAKEGYRQDVQNEIVTTLRGNDVGNNKANISDIATKKLEPFNGGKITYKSRYIQKSYTDVTKVATNDSEKVWYYKPSLLWEVARQDTTKSINEEKSTASGYALSAIPLNSDIPNVLPSVSNGVVINNTIDLGEGIYWIANYNGYFYANGEIIHYDAVEYFVSGIGNVWIGSVEEYQNYFSKIPFGGKLYPTGRLRIYTEPYYNENGSLRAGSVSKHGREQFATKMPAGGHLAGIGKDHWTQTQVNGFKLKTRSLIQPATTSTFKIEVRKASPDKFIKIHGTDKNKVAVGQQVIGVGANKDKVKANTKVTSVYADGGFSINKSITGTLEKGSKIKLVGVDIKDGQLVDTVPGQVGYDSTAAYASTIRTSIIRNFMSSQYHSESQIGAMKTTDVGTVQSSALVFAGPTFDTSIKPFDYISFVYNKLKTTTGLDGELFNHVGTRLRIIGQRENDTSSFQSPSGAMDFYNMISTDPSKNTVISASSGGISVLLDPVTCNGYYFEVAALSTNNVSSYTNASEAVNLMFYKVKRNSTSNDNKSPGEPITLWTGLSQILVDDGRFTGQYRMTGEEKPTVYDVAVEYEELDSGSLKFYLYLNNKLIGSVVDTNPLNLTPYTGLFIRGTSKLMFENMYAVKRSESANFDNLSDTPLRSAMTFNKESSVDESLRKYTIPESVCTTYLSGISPLGIKSNDIYFEEFGTIMREVAYFNIKYDKAYPALAAQIAPTFNKLKSYAVSGFVAGAYGAEFLVFNIADRAITLDAQTGNYLRIIGVTYTQESQHDYTVDEYFNKHSDLSRPEVFRNARIGSPIEGLSDYRTIQNSRMMYGRKDFNLNAPYLQSQDSAEELMEWIADNLTKPRLAVGMDLFGTQTLQLGDIVNINYTADEMNMIADPTKRFVVYSIDYQRRGDGAKMTVYLSEVV